MGAPLLKPGSVIQDRYEVLDLLGQGGMGAVYRATDQRLHITVALKQTLMEGPAYAQAFAREARLLAGLRHPGLPVVSDYVAADGGQILVMQYIPGDDLLTQLQAQAQPFPAALVHTWAAQLLETLTYLHGQEPPIIHRDIKPQNLKVMPGGRIVLLDFGLAQGTPWATRHTATTTRALGYSPHYAPLEQIQGSPTDTRSDLFALAATLYHLSTGEPPVDALARAAAVVSQLPDPLPSPRRRNPAISAPFEELLLWALRLPPEARPQSAAQLMEALARPATATIPMRPAPQVWSRAVAREADSPDAVLRPQPVFDAPLGRGVSEGVAPSRRGPGPEAPSRRPAWRAGAGIAVLVLLALLVGLRLGASLGAPDARSAAEPSPQTLAASHTPAPVGAAAAQPTVTFPIQFAYAQPFAEGGLGPVTIPAQDDVLFRYRPATMPQPFELVSTLTMHVTIEPGADPATTLDFMIYSPSEGGWGANSGNNRIRHGVQAIAIKYPHPYVGDDGTIFFSIRNYGTAPVTIEQLGISMTLRHPDGTEQVYRFAGS